jgi:hypothetical protein
MPVYQFKIVDVSRLRTLWALIAKVTQTPDQSKFLCTTNRHRPGWGQARCVIVVDENGTEIHKAPVKP